MPPNTTPEGQSAPVAPVAPETPSLPALNIENRRASVTQHVHDLVGNMDAKTSALSMSPLPKLPSISNLTKAAIVATFMAMPHAAPVAAVGGYAAAKTYKFAADHTPIGYLDRGAKKVGRFAWDGVKGAAEWGSYPFRLAGTLGLNTLKIGAKVAVEPIKFVDNLLEDLETIANTKMGTSSTVDLPAHIFVKGKNVLGSIIKFPFRMFEKYPKTTIATGVLGLGVLANAGFDPIIASGNLVKFFGELVKWGMGKFTP